MTDTEYPANRTALLVVDPYNDFMSEGGKLYDAIKETATAVGMFENLRKLLSVIRALGIPVFILPHHRSKPDDFEGWRHVNPTQKLSKQGQVFAEGSWGGTGILNSVPNLATSLFTSTGLRVRLLIPIWTLNSSNTASNV